MTKLRFVLTLSHADPDDPESLRRRFMPLMYALEALVSIDEWHLNQALDIGRPLPRLYDSGVRYREEPPGQEDWLDVVSLYKDMFGDCEDLACALAAERRVYDGIHACATIRHKFIKSEDLRRQGYPKRSIPRDGIFLIHVLTELPDGTIEDPSKRLGMNGDFS
jgi:hypothetical protein